jgi:hypothetical protein
MLDKFIETYYPKIAERIEQQQITYGLARIHSHRHIARCIIYSDWYCNLMNIEKDSVERMRLYFAIAFHDIGRQFELEDVWEDQSYEIYVNYLFNEIKVDKKIVNNAKELFINKYEKSVLNDIIHDVDCLDIMRSGTGRGGIMGFDRNYLNLFKEQLHLQGLLISSAWKLICLTDDIENDNVDCLVTIHNNNKNEWKILI